MPNRSDLKRRDEGFEALLAELEHQHTETDLTPDKRADRLAHVRNADTEAKANLRFAKLYYPDIFSAPWSALHEHIGGITGGTHSISGFRKAGKSALTYVAHIIRHVAEGRDGMVGVVLRTQDNAKERVASLARLIMSNKLLCYDYQIEAQKNGGGYRILNHVHIVAGSVNTGLRNYVDDHFDRFQVLIGDDLYDKESVRSEKDNERVYEFIVDEMWGQLQDNGYCIILGNKINDDCPIVRLEDAYPDGHFSFPILDDDGQPTWPEVYDKDDIEEMRKRIPHDVFMGQYMDQPIELGDVFDPEWLGTVNLNLVQIVATITTVDPAHGESPHACMKAACSMGITDSSECVVQALYGRRGPYADLFSWLLARVTRLPEHRLIYWENDFNQWMNAKPYYDDWRDQHRVLLPIYHYEASDLSTKFRGADKQSRILTLVHPHQTGTLRYDARLEGTTAWQSYHSQYVSYDGSKDDVDMLDAVAAANILIWKYDGAPDGTTGMRSLKQRSWMQPTWSDTSFH